MRHCFTIMGCYGWQPSRLNLFIISNLFIFDVTNRKQVYIFFNFFFCRKVREAFNTLDREKSGWLSAGDACCACEALVGRRVSLADLKRFLPELASTVFWFVPV